MGGDYLMPYPQNTIYITGTAKVGSNDPISAIYDILFIGIILEREDGKIVDITCNTVSHITEDFIKSIMLGYSLLEDIDEITDAIKDRFYGIAQKAVIAAIKDARNKYLMIKSD